MYENYIKGMVSEVELDAETYTMFLDTGEVVIVNAIDVVDTEELEDVMKAEVCFHVRYE